MSAALALALLLLASPAAAHAEESTAPSAEVASCSPPPTAGGRQAVFVSDTHFGVGRSAPDRWHPFEDFRWADDFVAFLEAIATPGAGATDLILNGDTFELWQSLADDCGEDRDEDLGCTEAEARVRLERVLGEHSRELRALGAFAARGQNRVVIVPGNHDAGLLYGRLAAAAIAALAAPERRACVARDGYWLSRDRLLYAEHGQQIGQDVNSFKERWPEPFTEGAVRHLVRTWGERFVQAFYNEFEGRYEAIDNVNDEGAGIVYGLAAEGRARSALGAAKFLKFLLLDQSWPQFVQLLAGDEEPRWSVAAIRQAGDSFLVESIPAGPLRQAAQAGLAEGELGLSLDQLSDGEILEICSRRAALILSERERGLPPSVTACPTGALAALTQRLLWSRDRVLEGHLRQTVERLVAAGRLEAGRPFQVFVYSHTHRAEKSFKPARGVWQPMVINTGAWQRLIAREELERLRAGLSDREVLTSLSLDSFAPCYSFVLVKPYTTSPSPLLRYWTRNAAGQWGIGVSCPEGGVH